MAAVNVFVTVLQSALSALVKAFAFCVQISILQLSFKVHALIQPYQATFHTSEGQKCHFLQSLIYHFGSSPTQLEPVFRIQLELGQNTGVQVTLF